MPRLERHAPILPVRDLVAALARYRLLGFDARSTDEPIYGFIERDGLQLHLAKAGELDPRANTSAVYLYVDDAAALYDDWRASGVDGAFHPPQDTPYGLREFAWIDPDGNLLRVGSPLPGC